MAITPLTVTVGQAEAGMGWMEFVAAMASALGWPAVLITVLLVFRRELRILAKKAKLTSIEAFGAKIDFGLRVDELIEAVEETAGAGKVEGTGSRYTQDRVPTTARTSTTRPAAKATAGKLKQSTSRRRAAIKPAAKAAAPKAAARPVIPPMAATAAPVGQMSVGMGSAEGKVLKSWLLIEDALTRAAKAHISSSPSQKPLEILWDLYNADVLKPETVSLVEEARTLRNLAAHGQADDLTFLSAQRYAHGASLIAERIRAECAV